jgi:hypothetical protein
LKRRAPKSTAHAGSHDCHARIAPACLPARYRRRRRIGGCLGRINYPVEAQFEKFLADRVQLSLDTLDKEDQPRLLRI